MPESSEPQLRPPGPETERPPDRRGRSQLQNGLGTGVSGEKVAFGQSHAETAPMEAAVMAHLAKGNSPSTRVKIVAKKTAWPHLPPPALRAAVFG